MGGAWKVAYADLVTGLFALFMCLWLTSVDEDVMEEIAEHFKNPNTQTKQSSPGTIDIKNANVASSRRASFSKPAIVPKRLVRKTKEDIEKSFVQSPEFQENENMHVEVIDEGIKLSLFNSPKRNIFEKNGPDGLSEYGNVLIDSLGVWLSRKYDVQGEKIGEMDTELFIEFFKAFTNETKCNLHIENLYGQNNHHIIESCFKAFAKSYRIAVSKDERRLNEIPSSKGAL